jgi:hypothetical protein
VLTAYNLTVIMTAATFKKIAMAMAMAIIKNETTCDLRIEAARVNCRTYIK